MPTEDVEGTNDAAAETVAAEQSGEAMPPAPNEAPMVSAGTPAAPATAEAPAEAATVAAAIDGSPGHIPTHSRPAPRTHRRDIAPAPGACHRGHACLAARG